MKTLLLLGLGLILGVVSVPLWPAKAEVTDIHQTVLTARDRVTELAATERVDPVPVPIYVETPTPTPQLTAGATPMRRPTRAPVTPAPGATPRHLTHDVTAADRRYPGGAPLDKPTIETWVARYTNEERQAVGLAPLVQDPAIADIARAHSESMVEFGLNHVIRGQEPTDRALDAGYDCRAYNADGSYSYGLSENISEYPRVMMWGLALGTSSGRPVEFNSDGRDMARMLVNEWMNSPGHRANILDQDARRIGVGVAIKETTEYGWTLETVYTTQNFSACQ